MVERAGHKGRWRIVMLAGFLIGCMKADRVVAVQLDGGDPTGSPFSAPTLVTGLRGNMIDLHDPTLTSDELEIYLSSDTGAGADLWTSTRTARDAAWSPAILVNELSSPGSDLDPDISPDGLTIYFSSDRASAQYQLYVSHRTARGQPWDPPQAMLGLGSSSLDMGPSVDPSQLFMIFASQRGTPDIRLYSASRSDAQGAWATVTEVSGIDSGLQDQNPALFNQGLSLTWSSRRSNNGATSDLFEVSRPASSASFSASPLSLDSLNSKTDWEGDPWLSQDGHHIVFVSDRNGGVSQIWEAWR